MTAPTILTSEGPPQLSARWTKLFDNSGTSNATIYIGWALHIDQISPATSAAIWTIEKLGYDANGLVNAIRWANGGDKNIWDNRASLTYF